MEIRHMEYFAAVAEELNFGRAAQRLNMTQPPLSMQIQQLEHELGVVLFHRTNRRVALTEAGKYFLIEVRKILAGIEQAAEIAQRAHRGEFGSLAVGFVGSATYDILPAVIREYRSLFPAVQLSLSELSSPAQIEALREGRIDVAILRPPVSDDSISTSILASSPSVIAVAHTHPLARKSPLSLADFAGSPFVMLSRKTWAGFYDVVLGTCMEAGFHPNIVQEALEFQTVISLVAAGIGVAMVPISAMNLHTQHVSYISLGSSLPEIAMGIAWRKSDRSQLLVNFLQIAEKCARTIGPSGEQKNAGG
ncbi:LysR family transcriptional regulator [Paenibacillus humicola]|uniref:LysR family transcriptional regulator n=1 Tax=Paenibacillus humicola TaxID=3110540 RepID=UPI00237B8432|nr:LysR family transcriptional regulator [Paenibacillus humicola]